MHTFKYGDVIQGRFCLPDETHKIVGTLPHGVWLTPLFDAPERGFERGKVLWSNYDHNDECSFLRTARVLYNELEQQRRGYRG